MLDAYSLLLALAIGAAAIAWVLLILSRWRPTVRSASTVSALLAVLLDGASLATHLFLGHRPGTDAAMSGAQFLAQHPALLVVVLASALALVLATKVTPHQRRVA